MEAGEALAAARRLDRSMDDLIGAARLDQGALMLQIETVDVIDVVAKALDGLHLPARLTITRTIAADLPFVTADPVLLTHIIANLLDNGLRHARNVIDLAADVSNGTVRLSISDDGTGVPDADRDHVFDRFVRIEGSDRTDGSGLGLAIVRGFADAMMMHVSLSTAPSGGARFTLVMPVAGPAATDPTG
jgi:two-component system sensor histidine kinase KdpD